MRVVLILGKRLNDDGTMTEGLYKRLAYGLEQYRELNADKIMVTGGVANKIAGIAEGDLMGKYIAEQGVTGVIVENKSMTTRENAAFCAPLLKACGATEVVLVTSNRHMYRRIYNPIKLFNRVLKGSGIVVTPKPCDCGEESKYR